MEETGNVPPMSPSQPPAQRMVTGQQFVSPTVSIGDWFLSLLVTSIPIVNIIVLLVWAFGSTTNPNKSNWAKAMLIWVLIGVVIAVVAFIVIGSALFSAMSSE